jgi:hypothetical protein
LESSKRKSRHIWFWAIGVSILVLSLTVSLLRLIPMGRIYCLKAECAQMPANDERLEEWLKAQTGVVEDTIHIKREGRSLRVWFLMIQNSYDSPPMPDLSKACDSLGYKPWLEWTEDTSASI